MKQTTNFSLNKPELTDVPDITVLNPNFDKIDTQLKGLADKDTELNTAIDQVKINYLPLSGGAMTGTIKSSTPNAIQRTTDDAELRVLGGTDLTSSYLKLFGKNHANYAGQFSWVATNGVNTKYLIGNPNGSLTWDGKNVVRSVNGNYANVNGEVNVDFYDYPMINDGDDLNNYVTDGTYICLLSVIAESLSNCPTTVAFRLDVNPVGAKSAGKFQILTAYDGGGVYLRHSDSGYWSEWMYIGGRDVVRSVNGKTVDTNGNVYIPTPDVYITETWNSGASWYRKWSDGWIEQGGTFTANPLATVTYPTAFNSVVLCAYANGYSASAQNTEQLKLDAKPTLTSLSAKGCYSSQHASGNMTITGYWYACGY